MEDIDKITCLLFGLSGRLARVEHELSVSEDKFIDKVVAEQDNLLNNPFLKHILMFKVALATKREKLQDQLDEAKKLKENIEQRNKIVCKMLQKYLVPEELQQYEHYVTEKAKVIMDAREIGDKISLFEDQLRGVQSYQS